MINEKELDGIRNVDDRYFDHEYSKYTLKLEEGLVENLKNANDLDSVKLVMFEFMVRARGVISDLEEKVDDLENWTSNKEREERMKEYYEIHRSEEE